MLQHIQKCADKNAELSERLSKVQIQENELRNRLETLKVEQFNTMKYHQAVEHIEKENATLMHDISSIPSGIPTRTRQDEIEELNEYDNVTQNSVNKYIKNVDK